MSKTKQPPKVRFLTSFVLPALLVFLIPVLSFFFFRHAQGRFDSQIRESILQQVRADGNLTDGQRARAIDFFNEIPVSQLMTNKAFASQMRSDTRFHYATFRWMIFLSAGSIVVGIGVFVIAGVCVILSLKSQYVQYLSLLFGWHVLRLYGALQAIVQGILLIALSFWVTALWTNSYYPKLILGVGLLAVCAVGIVIAGIFRRINNDFVVEGQVIDKEQAGPIWNELQRICERVGTQPPDQIIAGIDDNFFVTEHPVIVGERTYRGRTLFVSLSLLKQLQGGEADAVLAHEMAHFSGGDTLYSQKISPLLSRYDHYLHALREGGVTLPIYYFMMCFRALFQLSLARLSRQREFRADRIAVESTSPRAFAAALLRIVAYSQYRAGVERELFQQEQALESANVSERIEQGFHGYAASFVSGPDISNLAPAHPFDSHPPLSQRLDAIGIPLEAADTQSMLANPGDGQWYRHIADADQLEQEQWQEFEERFRQFHEQCLPYRFLPDNDAELALVLKYFPPITFEGKKGVLTLDHEKIAYTPWVEPILHAEITNLSVDDNGVLTISYKRQKKQTESLKTKTFGNSQQVLDALGHYYGRYKAAVEYQKQKQQASERGE